MLTKILKKMTKFVPMALLTIGTMATMTRSCVFVYGENNAPAKFE